MMDGIHMTMVPWYTVVYVVASVRGHGVAWRGVVWRGAGRGGAGRAGCLRATSYQYCDDDCCILSCMIDLSYS
jgi:hypothetical protein